MEIENSEQNSEQKQLQITWVPFPRNQNVCADAVARSQAQPLYFPNLENTKACH